MKAIRVATQLEPAVDQAESNPQIRDSNGVETDPEEPMKETDEYLSAVRAGYTEDALFKKVLERPKHHGSFKILNGTILATNEKGKQVTCIPRALFKGRKLTELVIDHGHRTVGHMGSRITSGYLPPAYLLATPWTGVTKKED